MKTSTITHLNTLLNRHPELADLQNSITQAAEIMINCHKSGGKILVCGNGGSAADSEHIVGELMKGFLLKREIPESDRQALIEIGAEDLCDVLQQGIQAIALTGSIALSTAVLNDNDPYMAFAQQVYAYGKPGDVLIGISTSGNARNVLNAAKVAKAFGLSVIGFTGSKPSKMDNLSNIMIKVPSEQTYAVQELHLPVYHTICCMVEEEIYG